MVGGAWPSSRKESSASSSRPSTGAGTRGCRVTLGGGSTELRAGPRGACGVPQWAMPQCLTTALLLEMPGGTPELLGAQRVQAELAPHWPPD